MRPHRPTLAADESIAGPVHTCDSTREQISRIYGHADSKTTIDIVVVVWLYERGESNEDQNMQVPNTRRRTNE